MLPATPPPVKKHLSFDEQLALMKSRGMLVTDDAYALLHLKKISYYRLSGYWFPFRKENSNFKKIDEFKDESYFEHIIGIYEFDRQLRLLVIAAVERIEVSLRANIAHLLGKKDTHAHTKKELLGKDFTETIVNQKTYTTAYDNWLEKLNESIAGAKDEFASHYKIHYSGNLPIWVVSELWEFGQLSRLFEGLTYKDQSYICKGYHTGLEPSHLVSWLKAINIVRNIGAHHGRLWNRAIVNQPSIPQNIKMHWMFHISKDTHAISRLYSVLCVIRMMMKFICPNDNWHLKLVALSKEFPATNVVSLKDAEFPDGWESKKMWLDETIVEVTPETAELPATAEPIPEAEI